MCKLAIKKYCFFCSCSCIQDKCLPTMIMMGGPMDTIQLLFNSLFDDIRSSGASIKKLTLAKCEEAGINTLKKKTNLRPEKY